MKGTSMMTWVSDTTSTELYYFGGVYIDPLTDDQYEKDESGKWWVFCDLLGEERGPFNTLEHACECIAAIYDEWAGIR